MRLRELKVGMRVKDAQLKLGTGKVIAVNKPSYKANVCFSNGGGPFPIAYEDSQDLRSLKRVGKAV